MKQFAVIGLDSFGVRMVDELLAFDVEILIIDKDPAVVEAYKDRVGGAFVADAINAELIKEIVPEHIDAAIVDLGDRLEASILVTSYLAKLQIPQIIAKATSEAHGEILDVVGATRVVFPDQEAANRVVPALVLSDVFSFLPLSDEFAIADLRVPERFVGKTVVEVDFRRTFGLNIIAFRRRDGGYRLFTTDYVLQKEDIFLVAGRVPDLIECTGIDVQGRRQGRGPVDRLRDVFGGRLGRRQGRRGEARRPGA